MMKKRLPLFLVFFVVLSLFLFYRRGGIDCIAGCRILLGIPFSYLIWHGSGIAETSPNYEFYPGYLLLDVVVYLLFALALTFLLILVWKVLRRFYKYLRR